MGRTVIAPQSVLLWLAGGLIGLNLIVSFLVVRSPFYTAFQKFAQCLVVWWVPLFGAIGVWAFLRAQYNWQKYDTRAYPEASQKMVAVEIGDAIRGGGGESGGHGGGD